MNNNIDYRKFLPASLRSTRWGELIQAFQSIMVNDIIPDKVEAIKTQAILEQMTTEEIKLFVEMTGFNLLQFEGYTSSNDFLYKEVLTIIPRVIWKTTRKGYKYLFYLFNLMGDVYPLYEDLDNSYVAIENWWGFDENPLIPNILDAGDDNILYYSPYVSDKDVKSDSGYTSDMMYTIYSAIRSSGLSDTILDGESFLILDQESFMNKVVRFILISFQYMFVESASYFLTPYTLKVFVNDILQQKKATERLVFEPHLVINYNADNSVKQTSYTNYDESVSTLQRTILIDEEFTFSDIVSIRFGTGSQTPSSSVTDVATYSFQILKAALVQTSKEDENLVIRKIIYETASMTKFSEIAIMGSSGCLLYSTFPMIEYPQTNLKGNIKFEFVAS